MGTYSFNADLPTFNGIPMIGGAPDYSGSTWFVDNNSGSDGNNGKSWAKPFKTLTKAATVNNLEFSRSDRWARRNIIYYAADTETVDLAIVPMKCDVIGVGCYGGNARPGITGNHVGTTATAYGCRFINIRFVSAAVASPIWTLAVDQGGTKFYNCDFVSNATTTSGILATGHTHLKVVGCRFYGACATSYITFGAGAADEAEIVGNTMLDSAAGGIIIPSSVTITNGAIIRDNTIYATTLCIDDDTNKFYVVNNECMSAVASTTAATLVEVIDSLVTRASNNRVTCGDKQNAPYPVLDIAT